MAVTAFQWPKSHAVACCIDTQKDYGIGTLHYYWSMSAHASEAFSTHTSARDCNDSEHLPSCLSQEHMFIDKREVVCLQMNLSQHMQNPGNDLQ